MKLKIIKGACVATRPPSELLAAVRCTAVSHQGQDCGPDGKNPEQDIIRRGSIQIETKTKKGAVSLWL